LRTKHRHQVWPTTEGVLEQIDWFIALLPSLKAQWLKEISSLTSIMYSVECELGNQIKIKYLV
jgi:hypothetical protein